MEKELAPVYSIERSLGRVEGKLDVLLEKFASHADEDASSFGKIHERLNGLERKFYYFTGIAASILAFLQFIAPNIKVAITQQ